MTKLGRLINGIIIYLTDFTIFGFYTIIFIAIILYALGEKKRKKLLSLLFKN